MTDIRLPDAAIEQLRAMLEASNGLQFVIGDHLVGLVDEFTPSMKRADIIRQLASGTGCDPSTLRDRETMSRYWFPDRRAKYAPLTYHQLRACGRNDAYSLECAEWALAHLPAPVAAIWQHRQQNGHTEPAWVARWDRVQSLCYVIRGDDEAPASIRALCQVVLTGLTDRQ